MQLGQQELGKKPRASELGETRNAPVLPSGQTLILNFDILFFIFFSKATKNKLYLYFEKKSKQISLLGIKSN